MAPIKLPTDPTIAIKSGLMFETVAYGIIINSAGIGRIADSKIDQMNIANIGFCGSQSNKSCHANNYLSYTLKNFKGNWINCRITIINYVMQSNPYVKSSSLCPHFSKN